MGSLIEERKRAASVIRKHESIEPEYIANAVESGAMDAWEAMVKVNVLPAVETVDALCRLRVVEAEADGRIVGTDAVLLRALGAPVQEYVRRMSDEALWLSRVYRDPNIDAEIDRRPHLRERRAAELAADAQGGAR
jgi:NAD(P)-dependent dehydrogenase (short-subunit alcohol dehydrogenase family)